MAKKLTAEEQSMVIRVAKVLSKVPYRQVRSSASGIASGLVRLRKDTLSVSDVDKVLGRYDCAGASARNVMLKAGVLVEADGGGFHLALPISADEDPVDSPDAAPTPSSDRGSEPANPFSAEKDANASSVSADQGASPAAVENAAFVPSAEKGGASDASASGHAAVASDASGRAVSSRSSSDARPGRSRRAPKHFSRSDAASHSRATEVEHATEGRPTAPVTVASASGTSATAARDVTVAPVRPGAAPQPERRGAFASLFSLFSRARGEKAAAVPDAATPAAPKPTAGAVTPATPKQAARSTKPAAGAATPAPAKANAPAKQAARRAAPAKAGASEKTGRSKSVSVQKAASRKLFAPGPRTLAEVPREPHHTPEATELRRKILDLDPRLWLNGWLLGSPEAYRLFEAKLVALDHALSGHETLGDGTLSCRELSYQVFGDEKFLEQNGDGRKLLERMGLGDIVRHRAQPKLGLLHHVPRRRPQMRIVVTENLDPWLDIRSLMYEEGRHLILGERVDGVVFGNGYLVDDARRLPEFLDSLGTDEVEVLYWGDLDRAGLQIYDRLHRVAEGHFTLRPFVAAYARMARRAQVRFSDPLDNEASAQEGVPFDGLDAFCAELPEDVRDYVHDVIAGNRLVPQEILTRVDL